MAIKEKLSQGELIGARVIIDTYRRNVESILEYDKENYYFRTIGHIIIKLLTRIDKKLTEPAKTEGLLFKLQDEEREALFFLRNQCTITRALKHEPTYDACLTLLLTQNN